MTTTTAPRQARAREGEEIWVTTTNGVIWYLVTDARGHEKPKKAGGKEGTRIRIKTTDRELNQDQIAKDQSDPWSNGFLKRIDADQNEDEATTTNQAFTTEELLVVFASSGNAFQSKVKALDERNVRRLMAMAADVDASTSQVAFLQEHIASTYRVEGSMPSYDEMVRDGVLRDA